MSKFCKSILFFSSFIYLQSLNNYIMAKKNPKQTSPSVATKASAILRNPKSTANEKSVAASDLAQARPHTKKGKK
jgi:hypothetical protein